MSVTSISKSLIEDKIQYNDIRVLYMHTSLSYYIIYDILKPSKAAIFTNRHQFKNKKRL